MSTDALTLTDFLLARIAEDETVARQADPYFWDVGLQDWPNGGVIEEERWDLQPHSRRCGRRPAEHDEESCTCGYPARVLAKCAALRTVVELTAEADDHESNVRHEFMLKTDPGFNDPLLGNRILRVLASVYVDHPDYRPEWAE